MGAARKGDGREVRAPHVVTSEVKTEAHAEAVRLARRLRKSASDPGIRKNYANLPQQIDSTLIGSQKYSFGKIEHGRGKFLIPRKSPRSSYLQVKDTPGAGDYDPTGISDRSSYRSAKYSFGLSGTERDPQLKRFTAFSHVRGFGHYDNPGPGSYFGYSETPGSIERLGGEKSSLQHKQPAYSMVFKRNAVRGYHWEPTPGADRYFVEGYKDNLQNKRHFPDYRIGTQKRSGEALINQVGTTELGGPGRYECSTSLVTKFPEKNSDVPKPLWCAPGAATAARH